MVPIITFGSEVWEISESDHDNLLQFQRYSGRRIQRFPNRSPNCSSFFGLGWLRITTYLLIKKCIFALTFLRMDADNIVRRVFIAKFLALMNNTQSNSLCYSPTDGIITAVRKFGILDMLCDMVRGISPIISKTRWSQTVWRKAWEYEDLYWDSTRILNRNNDLLYNTITHTRYISWWRISDIRPNLIRMCENLAKLVCHTSRLKCDDVRLKGLPPSHRTCIECDLFAKEDLTHIVMQCPAYHDSGIKMYDELYGLCEDIRDIFRNDPKNVFFWLIGKNMPDKDDIFMNDVLCISGRFINEMYIKAVRGRTGVG